MPEPSLTEKVLLIEECFRRHSVPHAFGGALALAYYATPRATNDIDVNVFSPVDESEQAIDLLVRLGATPMDDRQRSVLERDGQVRLHWGTTPVDLFFSYDGLHDSCFARRQRLSFGVNDTIHVLSAEDLLIFKTIFNRRKDWADIEELVFAMSDDLDVTYVRTWLERIVGEPDGRYQQLDEVLARLIS